MSVFYFNPRLPHLIVKLKDGNGSEWWQIKYRWCGIWWWLRGVMDREFGVEFPVLSFASKKDAKDRLAAEVRFLERDFGARIVRCAAEEKWSA